MTRNDERNDEEAGTPTLSDSWSRADFRSALPLYVGGDLDVADAAFVEAWIARHPADRELLEAARSAHAVLAEHGSRARVLPTPDLWPTVRAELARTGAFVDRDVASPRTTEPERSIPATVGRGRRAARHVDATEPGGRLLGGARWFERKAVAAAAAVLLTASIGALLVRSDGIASDAAAGDGGAAITRPPSEVRFVSARRPAPRPGPRAVPLQSVGETASHLIDEAPSGPLWQRAHELRAIELAPLDPTAAGAELVGGRR